MAKNTQDKPPIELPKSWEKFDYDDWLEFFRTITPSQLSKAKPFLRRTLPNDGYAAAMRWIEIIEEDPSKMDKLHQGRLKAKEGKAITKLAIGDDDEAFYEALILENVGQLNSGKVSPQEAARLSSNINIFRKELRDIRSRKPKKGTVLEKVLEKASAPKKQAPRSRSKTSAKKKTVAKSSGEKDAK